MILRFCWLLVTFCSSVFSFLLIFGVRCYQTLIRPLLPSGLCRFRPGCSEYFIESVKKYGPVCGAARGCWRLCRCGPWSAGGYDPP
jgi:hypothetical protein